ncbi:MAG: DEAD/DEAH box helicase, partial [Rhodoferax sp.]|nr:DEAD/DEAH box helicase [Rhodoferax sp.]
ALSSIDAASGLPQLPPFVYLTDPGGQGFVRLPTAPLQPWIVALLELLGDRSHDFRKDVLKLSRMDALRTSAALGEGAVWDGAAALRSTVQQLRGHAELPEVPPPANLQASLRPYQQQGVNWLQFLRQTGLSGILADDMGLGKTLQTLTHVLIEKDAGRLTRPVLVVAPVSLMGNWRREAERFTPTLRILVLHGKDRHDAAAEMASHDLIIAPYSLLQRDRERWLQQQWHLVVLDEAQNIKNANSNAAQVVSELNAAHRLCLSGTPMENHLGELWSLFHFLMPGFLGSQNRFKELFRNPIEKQGDAERLDQLRRRITPFMLRRTKREVAPELPDKIESISSIELLGKQADLYETVRLTTEKAVRDALDNKGLAKSQIHILDALLKLRQVCCDPRLLALASAKKIKQSAKLDYLMQLLPDLLAEGRRVLLFSQFTSMLSLIEDELKARGMAWVKLTGQSQNRDKLIERFTSGAVPLFLISLKAGGVGLNLPQADTVIHYDPWWNPAAENQATDRAHRIGQQNQVFVYKLVAQGTIEERILALQDRKAALADSMYSGSQGRKQPLFTESDVSELLKPLG